MTKFKQGFESAQSATLFSRPHMGCRKRKLVFADLNCLIGEPTARELSQSYAHLVLVSRTQFENIV